VEKYKDDSEYSLNKMRQFIGSNGGLGQFDFISQEGMKILTNN
jgi:hypothetical protein